MIERKTIENDEEYLRQISVPVSFEDETYMEDIKLLEQYCMETECFALAAVQIGIPKRIVVGKLIGEGNVELKSRNSSDIKIISYDEIIKGNSF